MRMNQAAARDGILTYVSLESEVYRNLYYFHCALERKFLIEVYRQEWTRTAWIAALSSSHPQIWT